MGSTKAGALRRVVVLVSAIVLLDVLFYSAIAPLLPTYVAHLHLSKTQAGVLTGSYASARSSLSLPAGWLAAHRGTRATLLVGLALIGAASIAFGLGDSFAVLTTAASCKGSGGRRVGRRSRVARRGGSSRETRPADRHRPRHRHRRRHRGPVLGAVAVALGPSHVFPAVASSPPGSPSPSRGPRPG